MMDKSVWETVPTVIETELQRAGATTVTNIRTAAANGEDHTRMQKYTDDAKILQSHSR